MAINYKDWCVDKNRRLLGRSPEQWLEEYTKWLFGPFPYHRTGEPLFAHGNVKPGSGCRRQVNLIDGPNNSVTVYEGDPIILEVIGVNFIIGDSDRLGNPIASEMDITTALDFEDQTHSEGKVEFKKST